MTTGPIKPLAEIQFHELKGVKAQENAIEWNGKLYRVSIFENGEEKGTLSGQQLQKLKEWMIQSKIEPDQLCALSRSRVEKGVKLKNVDQLRDIQSQFSSIIQEEKARPPLNERMREVGQRAMGALTQTVGRAKAKTLGLLGRINQRLGKLERRVRFEVRRIFQPKLHEKVLSRKLLISKVQPILGKGINGDFLIRAMDQDGMTQQLLDRYISQYGRLQEAPTLVEKENGLLELQKIQKELLELNLTKELSGVMEMALSSHQTNSRELFLDVMETTLKSYRQSLNKDLITQYFDENKNAEPLIKNYYQKLAETNLEKEVSQKRESLVELRILMDELRNLEMPGLSANRKRIVEEQYFLRPYERNLTPQELLLSQFDFRPVASSMCWVKEIHDEPSQLLIRHPTEKKLMLYTPKVDLAEFANQDKELLKELEKSLVGFLARGKENGGKDWIEKELDLSSMSGSASELGKIFEQERAKLYSQSERLDEAMNGKSVVLTPNFSQVQFHNYAQIKAEEKLQEVGGEFHIFEKQSRWVKQLIGNEKFREGCGKFFEKVKRKEDLKEILDLYKEELNPYLLDAYREIKGVEAGKSFEVGIEEIQVLGLIAFAVGGEEAVGFVKKFEEYSIENVEMLKEQYSLTSDDLGLYENSFFKLNMPIKMIFG